MVALLLKAGADPNQADPAGETPLMRAAEVGVLPVVQALLKHGAVVDVRDENYGQTALMFAARAGHADVVSMLLARGANANAATAGRRDACLHRAKLRAGIRIRRGHIAGRGAG